MPVVPGLRAGRQEEDRCRGQLCGEGSLSAEAVLAAEKLTPTVLCIMLSDYTRNRKSSGNREQEFGVKCLVCHQLPCSDQMLKINRTQHDPHKHKSLCAQASRAAREVFAFASWLQGGPRWVASFCSCGCVCRA